MHWKMELRAFHLANNNVLFTEKKMKETLRCLLPPGRSRRSGTAAEILLQARCTSILLHTAEAEKMSLPSLWLRLLLITVTS